MRLSTTFFTFSFLLLCTIAKAQDRCGSTEYNRTINHKSEVQFEKWLEGKKPTKSARQFSLFSHSQSAANVHEIPVVVHVIHNGEPVGTGVNIPEGQIISQIDVLNEDFRRLNADRVNTPANFQSVAADVEIEFVLAKRDPEGLATSGIVRTQGSRTSWSMSSNAELKQTSYWPAKDYINLWVTDVAGTLLGYAQFPESDELDGLEDASSNALTDGVVVDYQTFGSIDKFPAADLKSKFSKGRTATHEVGHFLGLRHIWGDENCGTDYCNDTPTQSSSTSGCPSHPRSNSCGTADEMFENFMDYTDDVCMNLFTQDQKTRIRTILDNSPRRKSLTTSLAVLDPVVYDYDMGLFSIISPSTSSCDQEVTPELLIKNYGNEPLNKVEIQLIINGQTVNTVTSTLSNIPQLGTATVTFPNITIEQGDNLLQFEVISVNDQVDQGNTNNTIEITTNIPINEVAHLDENFENGIPTSFSISNLDGRQTWSVVSAPDGSFANDALYLNYDNDPNIGSEDWLLSPTMNFSTIGQAKLSFEYAYSPHAAGQDELKVLISTDCGASYQPVFSKSGSELSTVKTFSSNYVPSGSSEWRQQIINLSSYAGESSVQLAWVGVNAYGNNIYLDNIKLSTPESPATKNVNLYPNPVTTSVNSTFNVDLDLDKRQPIEIRIFDIAGNQVFHQQESYALNQTFTYGASGLPSGMLILSVIGSDFRYNTRINVIR